MRTLLIHDSQLLPDADAGRFEFGRNWREYIDNLPAGAIDQATASMRQLLGVESLEGRRVIDVGSGSGIFSLAALRLGAAAVSSFDFDSDSVDCARELKRRYAGGAGAWTIQQGSVLDREFLSRLGTFDVVYSWGVLHHTGDMWRALENVTTLANPGGLLCVAIYNDQGFGSRVWLQVKRAYNALPPSLRFLVLWPAFARLWGPTLVRDALRGKPLATWNRYAERGMRPTTDVKDWVGGYPFEVATPARLTAFFADRGFVIKNTVLRSGIGCNELVFVREDR